MRRALLVLLPLCWFACKAGSPGSGPPGKVPDAGPQLLQDGGSDAGLDGGPDAGPLVRSCTVSAQDCDAGQSCLYVDGGRATACFSGACDLVRQDCGPDEKCSYRTSDAGVTARACLSAGDAGEGDPCPTWDNPNGCRKGLICVDAPGASGTGVCARLCDTDSDCSTPATCEELLTLGGTSETPSLCITLASCDLFAQDCSDAKTACYIGRTRPSCYPEGTAPLGAACRISSDCVKGAACAQDGQGQLACHAMCRTSGSPACASGTCTPAQAPAPEGVGICL